MDLASRVLLLLVLSRVPPLSFPRLARFRFKGAVTADVAENKTKRVEAGKASLFAGGERIALRGRKSWALPMPLWPSAESLVPAGAPPLPPPLPIPTCVQEVKKVFEERFKTGKSRWFFTKLRF